MKQRTLGRTYIKVSEIGFGGWAIGGNAYGDSYGHTEDDASLAAIQRALALGCTFFDTADAYGYGHSEELLGRALRQRPDVVVATKVGSNFYGEHPVDDFSGSYIRSALEKSRQRLQRDVIDVYQLHNPPKDLLADPRTYEILQQLKAEGRIRAYGVSVFHQDEALTAIEAGQPDVIQLPYNLLNTAAEELFPVAQREGVGIIAREPLASGFLSGKYSVDAKFGPGDFRADLPRQYVQAMVSSAEAFRFLEAGGARTLVQAALRFVLEPEAVSTVITGIKTVAQAEEDLGASDVPPLTPAERRRVRELMGRRP